MVVPAGESEGGGPLMHQSEGGVVGWGSLQLMGQAAVAAESSGPSCAHQFRASCCT